MIKHLLKALPRTLTGRKVSQLRLHGLIPANVFGKMVESKNIQINAKDFSLLRREVGDSTLVYLQIDGEKEDRPTLVREVATHPVSGSLLHITFHQVDLKQKVTAPVAVTLVGEAPAEKDKLGILVSQLSEIDISALPTDMPEDIKLDVSGLLEVNQSIKVSDLKLSSKLEVKSDPDAIVVKIEPLAAEEKEETPTAPETVVETPTTEDASAADVPDQPDAKKE